MQQMGIVLQLGRSPQRVCVCLFGEGETPGYHDDSSGQVAGVRAPAWLLLGGLSEFSSGMPHKNPAPPPPLLWPQEATRGEDHGKEGESVPLISIHR